MIVDTIPCTMEKMAVISSMPNMIAMGLGWRLASGRAALGLAGLLLPLGQAGAQTLPAGNTIIRGSGTITLPTINQTSTILEVNWNSFDVGPHRDFCRELADACAGTPVRFGVYHSVYEWFHPLYLESPERYATEHLIPMLKELIVKYEPNTLRFRLWLRAANRLRASAPRLRRAPTP